jgi:hypothetical protein
MKVHYRVDKSLQPVAFMSQINAPRTTPFYFYNVYFILSPKTCMTFRNKLFLKGEKFLVARQTLTLEDHPVSAARDCLFKIFAAILHIWRPFIASAKIHSHHAVSHMTS